MTNRVMIAMSASSLVVACSLAVVGCDGDEDAAAVTIDSAVTSEAPANTEAPVATEPDRAPVTVAAIDVVESSTSTAPPATDDVVTSTDPSPADANDSVPVDQRDVESGVLVMENFLLGLTTVGGEATYDELDLDDDELACIGASGAEGTLGTGFVEVLYDCFDDNSFATIIIAIGPLDDD